MDFFLVNLEHANRNLTFPNRYLVLNLLKKLECPLFLACFWEYLYILQSSPLRWIQNYQDYKSDEEKAYSILTINFALNSGIPRFIAPWSVLDLNVLEEFAHTILTLIPKTMGRSLYD